MISRALVPFLLLALAPTVWADAYYWVDENGKRHYSDRVPPQESKRERKVIDDRGFTVQTLPEQKTEAELQAAEAAKAEAEEQKQAAIRDRAEEAAYNSLLLTTYENIDELKHARDDRLSLMDAGLNVEAEAHADNHKSLAKLRTQEKQLQQQGKPVPDKLRKQINEVNRRIEVNERNMAEIRKQRAQVSAKFADDIARYEALTSGAN